MASVSGFRKAMAERFGDEIRFFKGWIDKPKAVGSIVPTSSITARRMASVVNPGSGLPVLEVGPGTGVITRAILARGVKPENLYAVEYSPDFVRHMRRLYPGVNVIEGDGFDLDTTLGDKRGLLFDCVISGVPLLNFKVRKRVAYLDQLLLAVSAWPSRRAADLRSEVSCATGAWRLHRRALPFHHPQHSTDATVDLSPRRKKLTRIPKSPYPGHANVFPHIDLGPTSPIPARGQEGGTCRLSRKFLCSPGRYAAAPIRSAPPTRR